MTVCSGSGVGYFGAGVLVTPGSTFGISPVSEFRNAKTLKGPRAPDL
jgi:hypothetical protein